MTPELKLTIFIVAASLLWAAYLFFALYSPIKSFLDRHFTVRMFYRTVNQVVLERDFYLINSFANNKFKNDAVVFDHIVIGDKFVYCIQDRYYEGSLYAKPENPDWAYYHHHKMEYIPNPIAVNKERVDRLSFLMKVSSEFFVPIVLINDDCFYTAFDQEANEDYLIPRGKLGKFIDAIESRPVEPLNKNETAHFARELARINHDGE